MSNQPNKFRKVIFIIFCLALMFFIMLKPTNDPDMGWHLQNGKYLLEHNLKVPATDIYSYTMSEYPLIMHEWLTDIGMYLVWNNLGLVGLMVIFGIITVAAFIIVARAFKAPLEYQLVAAVLGIIASVPILGTRAQMITLLFMAITIFIIQRYKQDENSKIIWWLPLVFLFWVNLHGAFVVGFLILGLYGFFEILKQGLIKLWPRFFSTWQQQVLSWRATLKLIIPSVISLAVTSINPYGYRIYQEVIVTITDSYAKLHILEWLPVSLQSTNSYRFLLYIGLLIILSIFAWRKLDISYIGIALVIGYFAFSSWRHMPLFMLVTIPFWVYIAYSLAGKILPKVMYHTLFLIVLVGATIIVARQQLNHVVPIGNSVIKLFQELNYPYKAVEFLKENPIEGNMFNAYNWGGFLIWQLPEQKVFIDGRMPHWKYNGKHILKDHDTVVLVHEGWPKVLTKYDINWILIYKNSVLGYVLKRNGWREVYSDSTAEILIKKEDVKIW